MIKIIFLKILIMKNEKIFDSSHISYSSESEVNKMFKSNDSLRRFNDKNNEDILEKRKIIKIKEFSYTKSNKKDSFTIKFLNQTIKENETNNNQKKKEIQKYKFNSPNKGLSNLPNKIFKISLNPFPSCINKQQTNSSLSNYIFIKNPSDQNVKVLPQSNFGKFLFLFYYYILNKFTK
jgi:hypothetical protein